MSLKILSPRVTFSHRYFPQGPFLNSKLPVLTYHKLFKLKCSAEEAEGVIRKYVARNGWRVDWTGQIFKKHHYHSTAHEALAIVSGEAVIEIAGPQGSESTFQKGDVVILPAGTVHKCLERSKDFLVVGMYPYGQMYDMRYGTTEDPETIRRNIRAVPFPEKDPFLGSGGLLPGDWNRFTY